MNKEKSIKYFNAVADKRKLIRRRNSYYWNDITRYCNYFIHSESSVIEIGCGNGEMLQELKGKRKVGIDHSPAMIHNAKIDFPNIEFHEMDAEDFSMDEKFDVILVSNLTGYLDDIQKCFSNLHQLCHRNTKVIITSYNYLWEPVLKFAEKIGLKLKTPDQNWLTKADLINLLHISGFEVYKSANRQIIPVNIPLVSWFFNKILAQLPLFNLFCINRYLFANQNTQYLKPEEKEFTVSVIVPARNEAGNIENSILRLPKLGKGLELIFIEGNSTDNTWETILWAAEKYKSTHHIKTGRQLGKGKGDAVRMGFQMATGDILMILDADLTVPPEDLPKFYDVIASGKGDFVNGSRLVYQMENNAMRFLNILGNKFFSWAFTWLLGQPFKDTLCGTKVIFRHDYERLISNRKFFGEFDPFGDFDLIFGAYKLNLKITEVPIRYKDRTYGSTNISRFKHGLILLRMCAFAARKIKFY
ncbi:MAG: glycosyltransferase [Bacteroidetes bacterium]|nr:glycosyltransferase [Bacteroidota bacterium]